MIPVRNIYYMLAYAFRILDEKGYVDVSGEDFQNAADICAAMLIKGVTHQLKIGLEKAYIPETEQLAAIKGRINISESIKAQTHLRHQMVCTYEEFQENTYMNRIVKTTMNQLLLADIKNNRKKEIRRLLAYFGKVTLIDVRSINWKMKYEKNNSSYRYLMTVCNLVLNNLIQNSSDGKMRMRQFLDDQKMARLYERFILEYFRKEYPMLNASSPQIKWQLDDDNSEQLPTMKSDIMLFYKEKVLIIDAKFYGRSMQQYFDKRTIISGNLYQIFTYVKNKEAELSEQSHSVEGMLLYARTNEEIYPNQSYLMSGNRISVKTLDLNLEFEGIRDQLDQIAMMLLS